MILILLSLLMGYIGVTIGGQFEGNILMYLFGIVGFFSPGLFVLEDIYRKINKKSS